MRPQLHEQRFVTVRSCGAQHSNGGYAAVLAAPFGRIGVRIVDEALTGIDYLPHAHPESAPRGYLAHEVVGQIVAYLKDPRRSFDLPFRVEGTAYQVSVWRAIGDIPSGTTRTYGDLASLLRSAPRAVGGACGSNPIPLIVPCHRVVSADGRIGGFMHSREAFPLNIKRWLLTHEVR